MSAGRCHALTRSLSVLGACLVVTASGAVWAQGAEPKNDLSEAERAERAKRDAEKVFQWIRFHADRESKAKKAAAAAPAPAPAPAARSIAAARPAPAAHAAPAGEELVAAPSGSELAGPALPEARAQQPVQRQAAALGGAGAAAGSASARPAPLPAEAPAEAPTVAAAPPEAATAMAAPAPAASLAAPAAAPEEEDEQPLKLLKQVEPSFPRQLMQQLQAGTVQVRFFVQADGSVRTADSIKSSHPRLVKAALDAVRQWRFEPIASGREAAVEVGFDLR